MDIVTVNRLTYKHFIRIFGNVVQGCSLCAAVTWRERPFPDVYQIYRSVEKFLDQLSLNGKEGIFRLFSQLASTEVFSSESVREQSSAGLLDINKTDQLRIADLNTKYLNKFEFPFVICSRQNKTDKIIREMERRLKNSKDQEIINGINQVKDICRLRLLDIVNPASKL